jgi:hypothetical protein
LNQDDLFQHLQSTLDYYRRRLREEISAKNTLKEENAALQRELAILRRRNSLGKVSSS